MACVRRRTSPRAMALGWYLSRAAASRMRSRVAEETRVFEREPLRTTETVYGLTPAQAAISLSVGAFLSRLTARLPSRAEKSFRSDECELTKPLVSSQYAAD